MTGKTINSFTVGTDAVTVMFDTPKQMADIAVITTGDVWFSWQKTAVVDDAECLKLNSKIPTYSLRSRGAWSELSFIATAESFVQVVVL